MRSFLSASNVCSRSLFVRVSASTRVLRSSAAIGENSPASRPATPTQPHSAHRTRSRSFHSLRLRCQAAEAMGPYTPADLLEPKFPSVHFTDEASGDLVAIGVYEEDLKVEGKVVELASEKLKELDEYYGGALSDIVSGGSFKGKPASSSFVREGTKVKWVGMVGLGSLKSASLVADWGVSVYQALGDQLACATKKNKAEVASVVFSTAPEKESIKAIGEKIAIGLYLGAHEITSYKTEPTVSTLKDVNLVMESPTDEGGARSEVVATGVSLARSLLDTPSNHCTPQYMADVATAIAEKFPEVMKLEILEREDCEKLNMGCYLAVARASGFPPKFIHMTYTPIEPCEKKIAVIGKGLSFDSGGYNIKMSMMEDMKLDMGGAAATLGAASIIAALEPKGAEIHFIIAACENMIGGDGYRPGDVLTASNGKTVEVINTDAEGRLTLADAIVFAQDKCGVSTIVESSTLTGACIVALGTNIAALYATNDTLAESLLSASREAGEKLWRMPLEDSYLEGLKSPIADLKNLGGRFGGSIIAGLFLREFVDTEKTEFAHLDIAGPAFKMDSKLGTGYGAALLAQWACNAGSATT